MTLNLNSKLAILMADRDRLGNRQLKAAHRLFTGVPSPNEPLRDWSPVGSFLNNLGWLGGFMALAGGAAAVLPYAGALSPVAAVGAALGAAGVVGRLRRFVVADVHEATHGVVAKWYQAHGVPRPKARWIAETILDVGTALTFTLNGQDYRRAHGPHHSRKLGTLGDPDGRMIADWGFWPGAIKGSFARQLIALLADPRWHLAYLRKRFATNFARGNLRRRLLAAGFLALLIAPLAVLPVWVWLAMIGLPWTIGYQIAAALQSLTEHPYGYAAPAADDEDYAERTWERFPYTPMPEAGLAGLAAAKAWGWWMFRMLGHGLARLTILDETMLAHGHHHRAWPEGVPFYDWWNTAHRYVAWRLARPDAKERAVWGVSGALAEQAKRMERR